MSDLTNELIRLGELREKGLITQEEFDAAKAKLLGQAADASDTGGPPPEMPPLEMPADMPSDPPQAAPQSRPSVLGKQVDDNIPPGIKGLSWVSFLLFFLFYILYNTC
ncbi:MAG: SHOCT domain-containing protein, partial [Arenimonas sp.]